jgi:hypothetical protein
VTLPETYVWDLDLIMYGVVEFGGEPQVRPSFPADEWQRVDLVVVEVLQEVAARAGLAAVLVLTAGDPERAGKMAYVYLEPCAHVVIALSHVDKKASITADHDLWGGQELKREFQHLIDYAKDVLQRDELTDAIISVSRETSKVLCARGNWARIDQD